MVSDADERMRNSVNLRLTEVVEPELLDGTEDWEGVPGQAGTWSIRHRAEFRDQDPRPGWCWARVPIPRAWRTWAARPGR